MIITVNGGVREVADGATVAVVVAEQFPDAAAQRGVAVAVDRRVVPRTQWAETVLADQARVEFVTAVQGG